MKHHSLWLSRLLFVALACTTVLLACAGRQPPAVDQLFFSCLGEENVTVVQTMTVENGTDGLLGIVQYDRDGSGQFFCSFVTAEGCYTCWLPSGWMAKEGTALTWVGDNTVSYTTANQGSLLPAVQWTFTYENFDGQPRITAHWEAVREPGFSAFLPLNPLLQYYPEVLLFTEEYPFCQWDLLPVRQYTVPPADGGHVQMWEVEMQGILAWLDLPEGQAVPSRDHVRQTAFRGLWRQNLDEPLTLFHFDDTLDTGSLAALYQEQEQTAVNEILRELPQMVLDGWTSAQAE